MNGKILLGDEAILSCPKGTVFDYVNLNDYSNIIEWNYSVSGSFIAYNCKNLEYVSPECVFGGSVNVAETSIKEWRSDVHGDFISLGSKIEKIINCGIKGEIYANDNVEIIREEKQSMRM